MRSYARYLLALSALFAQQEGWCGFREYEEILLREAPEIRLREALLEQARKLIGHRRAQHENLRCITSQHVIPVVVHVIYSDASNMIPFERVWGQMLRVFEDFRRVPETSGYSDAGADSEIEFSLATKDPNGRPSTGVVYWRFDAAPLNWTSPDFCRETQDESMKRATAWDPSKYLNIWVVPRLCIDPSRGTNCTECNRVAGYAYYPTAPAARFGTVIGANFFWGSGGGRADRTLVHELGHNLWLAHTFENGCGTTDCQNSGDRVCDTPPTSQASGNFVVRRQNTCTNDSPDQPDNLRNYMEYVPDADMTHFTEGQIDRAYTAISSNTLLTPLVQPNLRLLTGTGPYGYVKAYFTAWPPVACVGQPVRLYSYSMGMPHLYNWTLTGRRETYTATTQCPTFTITQADTYTVRLIVENLSGRRDTLIKDKYLVIQDAALPLPYRESFESSSFPPVHSYIYNPDRRQTWHRTTSALPPHGAYGQSPSSAALRFFDYRHYHEKDSWITPPLDLSPYTRPEVQIRLRFSYAYACLTYENTGGTPPSYRTDYEDMLSIYVSADCGNTWQKVWEKAGRALATIPNSCIEAVGSIPNTARFSPDTHRWRTDTILITSFKGNRRVRIRFEGTGGWGNNLFIDSIVVDTFHRFVPNNPSYLPTSASFVENSYVYENKLHLRLRYTLPYLSLSLYDIGGREVWHFTEVSLPAGESTFSLPQGLSEGVYFLRIEGAGEIHTLKYWHSP